VSGEPTRKESGEVARSGGEESPRETRERPRSRKGGGGGGGEWRATRNESREAAMDAHVFLGRKERPGEGRMRGARKQCSVTGRVNASGTRA